MKLKIRCSRCRRYLKEPSALIFSAPNEVGHVWKWHICHKCWDEMFEDEEWCASPEYGWEEGFGKEGFDWRKNDG